jgi:hypothetical protein
VHGGVVEPVVSKGDGGTFGARFIRIGDAPAGRDRRADAAAVPEVLDQHLRSSDIGVGSYVCMVTIQGQLTVSEIRKIKLASPE